MTNRPPITFAPGRELWEQQPHESSRQYERFLRYRDSGRMRSLTAVNKTLTALGDNLTYGTVRTQSFLYRWAERAQAWDRNQDDLDRDKIVKARRDMIDRHQKIAAGLAKKALNALRVIADTDLDPADIVRFLKLATDLETRALGEPNQTIAVTGPAGGPIQTEDLSALTAEERTARMRELAAEFATRAGLHTSANEEDD